MAPTSAGAAVPCEETPKLIIFDLDGTLYDDLAYATRYAYILASYLDAEERAVFLRECLATSPENRSWRIGMIYDRETDTLLGHPELKPGVAYSWESREARDWKEVEADGYVGSENRYLALGDAWMLITVAATRLGATVEDCRQAMNEMGQQRQPPVETYRHHSFFTQKQPVRRILVTNSRASFASEMVSQLGLRDSFVLRFTSARKPGSWRDLITQISENTGVSPQSMVAVGDNLINDVLPLVKLGVQAALLDRHSLFTRYTEEQWQTYRSIDAVIRDMVAARDSQAVQ